MMGTFWGFPRVSILGSLLGSPFVLTLPYEGVGGFWVAQSLLVMLLG